MALADDIVHLALSRMAAPRRRRFLSTAAGQIHIHEPGECTLLGPDGLPLHVITDASGVATQIEDDDHLHAVVRPHAIVRRVAIETQQGVAES